MRPTPEKMSAFMMQLKKKMNLKSLVVTLAAIVVFTTTYLLILPAFTLDKEEAMEQGGIDVVAVETAAEADQAEAVPAEDVVSEEPAVEADQAEAAAEEDVVSEESAAETDQAQKDAVPEEPAASKEETGEAKAENKTEATEKPEAVAKPDVKLLTEEKTLKAEQAKGDDFEVSAVVDGKSKVPEDVFLQATELTKDTEGFDYDKYYKDALNALKKDSDDVNGIKAIKFYDISLEAESQDESVEPEAAVNVKIAYEDGIKVDDANNVRIVHFAEQKNGEEKAVVLDSKDNKVETSVDKNNQMTEASFETDGFSVFAVVETETLKTEYISAKGDTYLVTVTYGSDAKIPQGSTLVVKELLPGSEKYDSYKADAVAALNTSKNDVDYVKLLDITIMNGNKKVDIAAPVDVKIDLLDKKADDAVNTENNTDNSKADKFEMRVVHFGDTSQEIMAADMGKTVSFSADSFSVYAIVGTTVDADFLTADGETLKVTVIFDKDEPLPLDAVLEVKELEKQDNEKLWEDRYQRLSNVLYANYGKSKTGESRFLSISVVADGKEYKPTYPIQVKISYDDAIYDKGDRIITIHYPNDEKNKNTEDDLNEAFIEKAEILDTKNTLEGESVVETVFETTGFSDYDLTTIGTDDSPTFKSVEEPVTLAKEATKEAPAVKAPGTRSVGQTPAHEKSIEDNGDGTYTLDLNVTGDADTEVEEAGNVNVLIVYDHSSSMTNRVSGGTATRADQAEDVVYDFVHSLFGYQSSTNPSNIQVGLVRFARTADDSVNWTSTESNITRYFDNGGTDGQTAQNYSVSNNANNGTNWESALSSARTMLGNLQDNDPTFVIFVTDGAPTASGNGNNAINPAGASLNDLLPYYRAARNNSRLIQTRDNTTLYGIYCYGTEADLLDDLMYYSNTGSERTVRTQTDLPVDHYYNTANTSALSAAIDEIFHQIVEALGIKDVSIHDGTTNQVTTTSGEISKLLEVDESTYKYWISIPYVNNRFTRIDLVSGEEITYNLRDNGNGTVTVTWGNNSITVTGTMSNGVFKYQWTEANALYDFAPPEAHLTNGAVDWDLSPVGTLLNNVTYSVTFECYPSQYTLDLIADLKNGKPYTEVDENERKYLHKVGDDYTLSTNTVATITYSDSRDGSGPITKDYNEVEPQSTAATKAVALSKDWSNILDDRVKPESLKMHVTRDGVDRYELVLNDADSWRDEAYISYGIVTIHDGNIVVKTPGHDYSFSEPKDMEYYWELDVPTLRPMLINATETMLVKVDASEAPEMSGDNATATSGGITYYKFTIDGKAMYYKVDESVAELKAVNNRRSYLNVTKKVDEPNAPADAEFSFDMTVVNSNASQGTVEDTDSDYWVWFSVFDTINNVVVSGEDLTINGTDLRGPNSSGYYWIPSGNKVTVGMKKGYNIRFLNLPTESTYSITESSTMPDDSFSLENITGNRHYKDEDDEEKDVNAGEVSGYNISGTIEYANSNYTMTFDNKYSAVDIKLKKVNENGEIIGDSVFKLTKEVNGTYVSVSDELDSIQPGDTEATNPVDLGGLGIGNYRLTETAAPNGYVIIASDVDFEVYKDNGTLKAKLADGTDPSLATISEAGAGNYVITITNTPGEELPMTGGIGTTIFYILGSLLVVGCGIMLVSRRRADAKK